MWGQGGGDVMWEARRVDQWGLGLFAQHFPLLGSKQIYPVYPRGRWIYHTCPARSPRHRGLPLLPVGLPRASPAPRPPLSLPRPPLPLPLPPAPLSLTCLVVDLCVHGQAARKKKEKKKVAFNYTCSSYPAANK